MSECVIPAANIKALAKFLTTLAKFGDDIYLDYRADKAGILSLSTFNTAKSAYAVISVQRSFFESYIYVPGIQSHRLLIKPLANIFRNGSHIDTIEQCRIKSVSDNGEERLLVQLTCRFGVLKTHRLNFEACESIQPVYSKDDCLHKWVASPRMIHDLLSHFQQKLKEVTLSCGISWFKIKSFEDSFVPDGTTVVRSLETEITVDIAEFDLYQVFGEADLTFELKDFKAALSFAESVELPIVAHFDQNQGPIAFSCVPYPSHFSADFVVAATLNANVRGGTQPEAPQIPKATMMQSQAATQLQAPLQMSMPINEIYTPRNSFPKYQLQLQQHQSGRQMIDKPEYDPDASGTVVLSSQDQFRPLPGLHHDHVQILAPQSPTESLSYAEENIARDDSLNQHNLFHNYSIGDHYARQTESSRVGRSYVQDTTSGPNGKETGDTAIVSGANSLEMLMMMNNVGSDDSTDKTVIKRARFSN
ncbi:hypothetical protein BASA83_005767 [Batrachochytrium salamandrivorans]|nr:hypothetical protein BASA83_005767 [Batrachochytrium salamandrivorans]